MLEEGHHVIPEAWSHLNSRIAYSVQDLVGLVK